MTPNPNNASVKNYHNFLHLIPHSTPKVYGSSSGIFPYNKRVPFLIIQKAQEKDNDKPTINHQLFGKTFETRQVAMNQKM